MTVLSSHGTPPDAHPSVASTMSAVQCDVREACDGAEWHADGCRGSEWHLAGRVVGYAPPDPQAYPHGCPRCGGHMERAVGGPGVPVIVDCMVVSREVSA